jgi:hypothetical protein
MMATIVGREEEERGCGRLIVKEETMELMHYSSSSKEDV